ncbi:uncharacterized protein LOC124288760 [Haliotis rubra]|uniref:uncharacterized protein LOC124288760 n=1 Tax=Haliotis rubra TaxID=36100 RepID=UPI001EE583B4|nr:uncharacterized protein LOC124288760 [Haliotis rubra]
MKYIVYLILPFIYFTDVLCISCGQNIDGKRSTILCEYGCCGSINNRTCCENKGALPGSTIAGITIAVVCAVVAIIVIAYVCERKYYGKRGRSGNPINPYTHGRTPGVNDLPPPRNIGMFHVPAHSTRR